MPIQIDEEDGGRLLAIHVSGKLVKADDERLVPEFERCLRQHGKLRLLVDMATYCKPFTKATVRYFDRTDGAFMGHFRDSW